MQYRLAQTTDFVQLAEMRWDFRAESGEEPATANRAEFSTACLAYLRTGYETGSRVYWVAEENGSIIAHLFVQKVEMMPRPCRVRDAFAYLTNSYTRPAYRQQGIGAALLEVVKQWAREQDFELLLTWPSTDAIRFYERAGFERAENIWALQLRDY